MFNLVALSAIALSLAAFVPSLAAPRATPPPGWNTPLFESYDTYRTRYMALACNTEHGTAFFDQCCHPLLAAQSLASRPAQCNPVTSSKPAPPVAAPSSALNDDDNDGDDDESTTKTAPAVTPPKKAAPPPPAPTQPVANCSTPSSVKFGGFADLFLQNGVAGACGTVYDDSDMFAGIDQARYGDPSDKSSLCGRQVEITNVLNGKSVTVTIAGFCPYCLNPNSMELSLGAFQKIATLEEGLVPISWYFV